MTNESFTSRRQIAISAVLILAGLSMLLIPGVPAQVATVPTTALDCIGQAWEWLGGTFSTVWNWLF